MNDQRTLPVSLELGAAVPGSLGDCTDALAEIRALRIELEHKAEAVKKRENEIEEHIVATCERENSSGAVGARYTAKLTPKLTTVIEDWGAFTGWVIKTGQTQVLYKRVNEKAVAELQEAQQPTPDGLGAIRKMKLSLTKT